ncbi:hypothetical protein PybrP1_010595 [[Pythium] brassicae (nom. inval.)]|nr:hypothetical protein PybrP1_010595 [[Pythium] brassicae (nom. inval.)]
MRLQRQLFAGVPKFSATLSGLNITSHQVWNMIAKMNGSSSPESRVRRLIDTFVATAENSALFVQDDVCTTHALALQTGVQNASFELWGDCQVTDWTHCTNNLGYHLSACSNK